MKKVIGVDDFWSRFNSDKPAVLANNIMPRLEYFLVSESGSLDRNTGRVSVFNIIQEESPDQYPHVFPVMCMVACFIFSDEEVREKTDYQVQFVFSIPGQQEDRAFPVNFVPDSAIRHLFFQLASVPITQPGNITIRLTLNGEHQATHTIAAKQASQPDAS